MEPEKALSAWVHVSAVIVGAVKLGDEVSVWPGVVLRGDVDRVEIGPQSNIQDLAVLHPNRNRPVVLGRGVTVGHGAIIHGSVVGEHCLIGMGSIVMESEIGEFSIVAAGAVVKPGSKIPPRSMVMGLPGKVVRALTDEEIKSLVRSKEDYLELANVYRKNNV